MTDKSRDKVMMTRHAGPPPQVPAEAYALFEELRALLYRLSEEHPARPAVHTAAVSAFCYWRDLLATPIADATERIASSNAE